MAEGWPVPEPGWTEHPAAAGAAGLSRARWALPLLLCVVLGLAASCAEEVGPGLAQPPADGGTVAGSAFAATPAELAFAATPAEDAHAGEPAGDASAAVPAAPGPAPDGTAEPVAQQPVVGETPSAEPPGEEPALDPAPAAAVPAPAVVADAGPGPARPASEAAPGRADPRHGTCREARAAGYGPYVSGQDPEYDWYRDADSDGIVCE